MIPMVTQIVGAAIEPPTVQLVDGQDITTTWGDALKLTTNCKVVVCTGVKCVE
jgi:hypothetical protein